MSEVDVAAAIETLDAQLRAQFGDAVGERRQRHEMPEWDIAGERLADVCAWLKADQGLNHLELLSTVDRLTHLDVVYFLDAMPVPPPYLRLVLRVRLDREQPRVPSVAGIWRAGDWFEREAYDLMGVVFEGHPDLRRIVLPDCWDGHPLRKDYRYDSSVMVDTILETELGPAQIAHRA